MRDLGWHQAACHVLDALHDWRPTETKWQELAQIVRERAAATAAPWRRVDLWVSLVLAAASMSLLQAASAACGQSRLRVRLALAHDHLANSADPKEAAQAYVAAGNALGCANSTFAKSLTKYLRRMLRDVVVLRCCFTVGLDCRDRLSAEFNRVFESVDAGLKTSDTEKDIASMLPGCKISTRTQKQTKQNKTKPNDMIIVNVERTYPS